MRAWGCESGSPRLRRESYPEPEETHRGWLPKNQEPGDVSTVVQPPRTFVILDLSRSMPVFSLLTLVRPVVWYGNLPSLGDFFSCLCEHGWISPKSITWHELHLAGVVWSVAVGAGQPAATLCSSCLALCLTSQASTTYPPPPASFLTVAENIVCLRAILRNFHPLAGCLVTLFCNVKKNRLIAEVTRTREWRRLSYILNCLLVIK